MQEVDISADHEAFLILQNIYSDLHAIAGALPEGDRRDDAHYALNRMLRLVDSHYLAASAQPVDKGMVDGMAKHLREMHAQFNGDNSVLQEAAKLLGLTR